MMIPIGVEASTATAPAVDGAVPTGFRDGLLAALSAGASTPAVELAQMVKLSGSAAVAAPTSTVTSASASASVSASATSGTDPQTTAGLSTTPVVAAAADLVALDVTSQVSGATGASAATSVSGADTTPVAPAPELAAAVVKAAASGDVPDQPPVVDSGTPPVPPVWSAKGRPGRRVTLQSPVLESIEANRSPGNTPQHRRVADLGQDLAIRQSPAVANAAGQALGGQPTPAQNLAIPVTPTESATIVTAPSAAEVSMVASTAVAPQAVATATTTVKPSITKDGTTHAAGVGDVAAGNATEVEAAKDVVIGQAALLPPARQPVVRNDGQPVRTEPTPSAATFALIDAGARRDSQDRRHGEVSPAQVASTLPAITSIASDRSDPTPVVATGTPPVAPGLPSASSTSAPRSSTPLSLGMIGVDLVRFAREQAPSRAVQRLAIDLDGAQVALRFSGGRVAVDVLNDPSGTLGNGWARQVERSLDQAARTVAEPQHGAQAGDQRQSQPGDTGRRGATPNDSGDERQHRSTRAFELFPEEEV